MEMPDIYKISVKMYLDDGSWAGFWQNSLTFGIIITDYLLVGYKRDFCRQKATVTSKYEKSIYWKDFQFAERISF